MSFSSSLNLFSSKLKSLSHVTQEIQRDFADYVDQDLERTYMHEQDPYGRAWKPRSRPDDGHPILYDTGEMHDSRQVKLMPDGGIDISYDSPSQFHQRGTENMPRRQMVPEGKRLPKGWRDQFAKIFRRKMRDLFGD